MTVYTEGRHTAEYIVSEANGTRSRETVTLLAGNDLPAGAVLAQLTTGANAGKYTVLNPDSIADPADGTLVAKAILFAAVNAVADHAAVITARDTEVKAAALGWPAGITTPEKATALAELAAIGIVAR
jgi:hypothetical protein